ncbi:MAG: class I SAM-dependent methyltransferase [Chlorobiota bacterium]
MRKFVTLENGNRLCPNCGSLPRTRRLWELIRSDLEGKTLLHFSPSSSMKQNIAKSDVKKYITTDYEDEFQAEEQYDIQNIELDDNSVDRIICFHILEHIPDDKKAMKELYRILKKEGLCYIQTPFKEGEIYESESITTPEGRLEHFGQEDHLRIYSVTGLKQRLEEAGFGVEVKIFENDNNVNGFENHEIVLLAKK